MTLRWLRTALLFALAPTTALAFEAVDTIPYPSLGRFPAYPREDARQTEVWAGAGLMYDSNVLRVPSGTNAEAITRLSAGVRTEGRIIGRQSARLEAIGELHDYWDFSELDHFAYGLRGEWLWEIANSLAGTAGYSRRQRLADVGELQRPTRDMITEERLYAGGAWRVMPSIRLTGGADYAKFGHTGRAVAETQGGTLRGGAEYVSGLGNAIGVEGRVSRGDAPVDEELGIGVFVNNDYEEKEVAGILTYGLGTQFRLIGRLGHTTRTYTELPDRNFSGTTWRAGAEWLPGLKTSLVFETYHEPSSIIDVAATHVVRTGYAFGPSWAPTAKLVFSARFVNERRLFEGDPSRLVLGTELRDETIRLIRLASGWEPQRFWFVGGALDFGERRSNTLGRDYDYFAAMINVRYAFDF